MRSARVLLSVGCVLLSSAYAAAGPLVLNYRTEVLNNDGARIDLPAAGSLTLGQQSPGAWRGNVSVFIPMDGSAFPGATPPDPEQPWATSTDHSFQLRLTLTDPATGASGDVTVTGGELADWIYRPDEEVRGWAFMGTAGWVEAQPVTIGGTTYRFEDGDGVGVLAVNATANTPEPGTLLMAAGGLTSLAGVAVRRRRKAG
jgi:hypothetical protein